MGDPGESDLIGKKVGRVSFGLFASEAYLAAHPAPRTLAELSGHDIIGTTADFPVLQGEQAGQMPLKTYVQAAAERRSRLRVAPLAGHFAAAAEGLGLALLAVPFALAEKLVRVLPEEIDIHECMVVAQTRKRASKTYARSQAIPRRRIRGFEAMAFGRGSEPRDGQTKRLTGGPISTGLIGRQTQARVSPQTHARLLCDPASGPFRFGGAPQDRGAPGAFRFPPR